MRTVRCSVHLSCHAHPLPHIPLCNACPLPLLCTPPTMHAPTMHTPCHTWTCYACPLPCMPHPAMHASHHATPSAHMPPTTHAPPTPLPHTHTLVDRILDTRLWEHYLSATFPNSLFVYWDSETSIEVTISRITYSEAVLTTSDMFARSLFLPFVHCTQFRPSPSYNLDELMSHQLPTNWSGPKL